MGRRKKRKELPSQYIGYLMGLLLVFVAASQSTDQFIFASWFVSGFIAHLLSAGMTGLLIALLVAEQFKLEGFARTASIAAIVLLLLNQAVINVIVNLTIAEVNPSTVELLAGAGLSSGQVLLVLSVVQGAFRPLLEALLWPVVAFVLTKGEQARRPFRRAQEQTPLAREHAGLARKQLTLACDHPGCTYEATEPVLEGNREAALSKAKRRVNGHKARVHSSKVAQEQPANGRELVERSGAVVSTP